MTTTQEQALYDALEKIDVPNGFTLKRATGEIATVLGVKQDTPIPFAYQWLEADSPAVLREAGKWPNDAAVLTYANGLEERNALSSSRAKAMKATADEIVKTVEYRRAAFVKTSVDNGIPKELAEGLAAQHIKE
jgi:hypothetical protein